MGSKSSKSAVQPAPEDEGVASVHVVPPSPSTPVAPPSWQVVAANGINVRSEKSTSSTVLAKKVQNAIIVGRRDGNWVALSKEPGYVLIEKDGRPLVEKLDHAEADVGSGSQSVELVTQLRNDFSFKGYIPQAKDRAITPEQLMKVVAYASNKCKNWYDTAPAQYSATAGKTLDPSFMNLYHMNGWIIMPATKEKDCSFVELCTSTPQTSVWFCSHWWGERVIDFARCVEGHVGTRSLTRDTGYWVCAYANRQHSLSSDVTSDPTQTSFYKAMKCAVGILLILDDIGPATPFTRIWCAFEVHCALDTSRPVPMLFDLVACKKNQAFIITDGVTINDKKNESEMRTATRLKAEREASFPIDVLKRGIVDLKLERAKASCEDDRIHILNCLAKRKLSQLPVLEEHPNYTKVNKMLQSRLTVAAWRQVMEKGQVEEFDMPQHLSEDEWRQTIAFDFSNCKAVNTAQVKLLVDGFPDCMRSLELNVTACENFADEALVALAAGMSPPSHTNLKILHLNLRRCTGITDDGISAVATKLFPNLEELHLNLSFLPKLGDASVQSIASNLSPCLKQLSLNVERDDKIRDASVLQLISAFPKSLKSLSLDLRHCKCISDTTGEALQKSLATWSGEVDLGLNETAISKTLCADLRRLAEEATARSPPAGNYEVQKSSRCCVIL